MLTMGCKSVNKLKPMHRRKGLWSPEEDEKLRNYVLRHGHSCWSSVPAKSGLQRNGKSCRLRWINYLRPGLKRGTFTLQDEELILSLHHLLGNKWSQIAQHFPGRTDNEMKNYWNSHLKKKVNKVEGLEAQTNTSYINLFPESIESTPTPNGYNTQVPSIESFEYMKGSLTDTKQSIPQVLDYNPPGEIHQRSFPKLLFAEWLSPDSVQSLNFIHSGEGKENDSNFNDVFGHGSLHNEGLFAYEFDYGNFSSQFKFENQIQASGFLDFDSMGEMCSDFNMTKK